MMRHRFLALAVSTPLVVVAAACGSRTQVNTDAGTATTIAVTTTVAPITTAPQIAHPMGKDDVVLRLMFDGGFVAPDFLFTRLPQVVITGDGSVYFQGVQIQIYPQPLLAPIMVGKITEAQLQVLLLGAQDDGLFSSLTYAMPTTGIADAPNTVLTINANGATYTHDAYALAMTATGAETDTNRRSLRHYVARLDAVANGVVESSPFAAERFAVRATSADQAPPMDGVTPNVLDWSTAAGVKLADANDCKVVDASAVGALFAQATQISRFVDDGIKYVLVVRPLIPGDAGC